MSLCSLCHWEADVELPEADGGTICFDCCWRRSEGADKCGKCPSLSACSGGQLIMAEKRNKDLKEVLQNLYTKLPHEKMTSCGVGRCAGCGVVLYCGDGKGRDPCKPSCALRAAEKILSR